ncbi:MAG: bacterial transcriptional activator domain-containing protein [Gemmatimonadaceae bacterium]
MIELRLLGTIDLAGVARASANELLGKPQATALLAHLALVSPIGFQRRDSIATLFWPEVAQHYARANLRKLLLGLRATLGKEAFETRGDEEVRIDESVVWCDAVAFRQAFRDQQLTRAMEIFRGTLMPGFSVSGSPGFQDWLDTARRECTRDAVKMLLALAQERLADDEHTDVGRLAHYAAIVDSEIQDERDLRKLIDMLDRIGDRAGALELYERFRQRLQRDHQCSPSKETRALIERIRTE